MKEIRYFTGNKVRVYVNPHERLRFISHVRERGLLETIFSRPSSQEKWSDIERLFRMADVRRAKGAIKVETDQAQAIAALKKLSGYVLSGHARDFETRIMEKIRKIAENQGGYATIRRAAIYDFEDIAKGRVGSRHVLGEVLGSLGSILLRKDERDEIRAVALSCMFSVVQDPKLILPQSRELDLAIRAAVVSLDCTEESQCLVAEAIMQELAAKKDQLITRAMRHELNSFRRIPLREASRARIDRFRQLLEAQERESG